MSEIDTRGNFWGVEIDPFYVLGKTYWAICKNKIVIMVWRGTEWTPEIYEDEKGAREECPKGCKVIPIKIIPVVDGK